MPQYESTVNMTYMREDAEQQATLDLLGHALDEVSYQSLDESYPGLTEALREVVKHGYAPQQIRQYCIQREMPITWARWLEQAARFLRGGGDG